MLDAPTQSRVPVNGKVLQVTDGGIRMKGPDGRDVMVVGYRGQAQVAEGQHCRFIASDSGTAIYTTVMGAQRQVEKYTYISGHVEK